MELDTPFSRIGSKRSVKELIAEYIPKHKKYVEPFLGAGVIFFHKDKAKQNVLNDIDKDLIKTWKMLPKIDPNPEKYPIKTTVKDIQKFVDSPCGN